jgi:hypothetical protein
MLTVVALAKPLVLTVLCVKAIAAKLPSKSAVPLVALGEIVPEELDQTTALGLLRHNPLLIRRPLLQVGDEKRVGFDAKAINDWIGLSAAFDGEVGDDPESCRQLADGAGQCTGHDGTCCHEPRPALET